MNNETCASVFLLAQNGCAHGRINADVAGSDYNLSFLEFNSAFEDISGFTADEIIKKQEMPEWLSFCCGIALRGGSRVWLQSFPATGQSCNITVVSLQKNTFVAFLAPADEKNVFSDKTVDLHTTYNNTDNYRLIFEQASVGIASIDMKGHLININQIFCNILGYEKTELLRMSIYDITHPEDLAISPREFLKLREGSDTVNYDKRYVRKDGSVIWVFLAASLLTNADGSQEYLVIIKDITERKLVQESLRRSEAKLNAMLSNIVDVISIISNKGVFEYVSPNVEKWFGWCPEQLLGVKASSLLHPEDGVRIRSAFGSLNESKGANITEELRCKCSDGSYKYIELKAVNMLSDATIQGILMNFHDITERKSREKDLIFLSYHDVLTGLYNRAYYTQERKRLDTKRQLPISVITGDINGLKLTNDMFGHAMGDKLLVAVAKILKSCCRSEDIVARVGGDEFSILLPQTDGIKAQLICRRILSACHSYKGKKAEMVFPSIAIGCATKERTDESMEGVLMDAEEAMYKQKLTERKSYHSEVIASIKKTMFEKSQLTEEHAERMSVLSRAVGHAVKLHPEQLSELDLLANLHDIGKISIDSRILIKPGKLNAEEWSEMKKHPEIGYRIAQASPELAPISDYILCHHERWDGKGYPQGLSGEAIPLLSRIIAIIDAYDAMTHDRPYRHAMTQEAAIEELTRCAGTQFDAELVEVFKQCVLGQADTEQENWQLKLMLDCQ